MFNSAGKSRTIHQLAQARPRSTGFSLRALAGQAWWLIRRRIHDRKTRKLLAKIEQHQGKLPQDLRRRADEYAREVLGHGQHALGLYVYAAMQREFKEGWIPHSYYDDHVLPRICHAGRISNDRHLARRILNSAAFPDAVYVLDGHLFDQNYRPLAAAEVGDIVFARGGDAIFKRNGSARGRGVYRLRRAECAALNWQALPDGVIQSWVTPHAFFNQLVPDGGPTIRLFTVVQADGDVSLRSAYLRIARGHHRAVSPEDALNIPIDLATGRLQRHGFFTSNLQPTPCHPDTGCVFEGKNVPAFAELVQLTLDYHRSFRLSGAIGWDTTIDAEGRPQIYEWNLYKAAIRFIEATMGPAFVGLGWENLWKS